jgi:hypothetical protein
LYRFANGLEDKKFELAELAMEKVLHMGAHVFWRLEEVFNTWPYRLLLIVFTPTWDEQLKVCQQVYDMDECCIDRHATGKARKLFDSARSMCKSECFRAMLLNFGHCPLANMHIERMLALIRASVGKSPLLEQLLDNGYLTQVLSAHLKSGGKDPRVTTREDLVKAGAPIRAVECPSKSTSRHLPEQLLYANHVMRVEKRVRIASGADNPNRAQCEVRHAELAQHFLNNEEAREEF